MWFLPILNTRRLGSSILQGVGPSPKSWLYVPEICHWLGGQSELRADSSTRSYSDLFPSWSAWWLRLKGGLGW